MVHLTKIYTKTGDKGGTSLANGMRVNKISPLMMAIGDIDEVIYLVDSEPKYEEDQLPFGA